MYAGGASRVSRGRAYVVFVRLRPACAMWLPRRSAPSRAVTCHHAAAASPCCNARGSAARRGPWVASLHLRDASRRRAPHRVAGRGFAAHAARCGAVACAQRARGPGAPLPPRTGHAFALTTSVARLLRRRRSRPRRLLPTATRQAACRRRVPPANGCSAPAPCLLRGCRLLKLARRSAVEPHSARSPPRGIRSGCWMP